MANIIMSSREKQADTGEARGSAARRVGGGARAHIKKSRAYFAARRQPSGARCRHLHFINEAYSNN